MKIFKIHTKQNLPITIEEGWDFLSDPRNLSIITPNYMNFKITDCDFRPVYHCDSQTWAAAWYGNIDAPYEAGTSFYAHKETGLRGGEPNINGAFGGNTWVDPTPYVKIDTAANIFNRLVIWDAKLIHAAPTYFGHDIDTARLTQVFFFDTEN